MAINPHHINGHLTDKLRAALAARQWDVYAVGATGVIRSPDRRVLIVTNFCTVQDIVSTVNAWWPPLPPPPRDGH